MAKVMIDCPKTGKPLYTQKDVTPAHYATSLSNHTRVVFCPHCYMVHQWYKECAYLVTPDERLQDETRKTFVAR